jgi:HK97 family phage major capsid protein
MVSKSLVAADVTDEALGRAAADAMVGGRLSPSEYETLTAEENPANRIKGLIDSAIDERLKPLQAGIDRLLQQNTPTAPPAGEKAAQTDSPQDLYDRANKNLDPNGQVRVKAFSERYSGVKSAAVWAPNPRKEHRENTGEYAPGQRAFILEGSDGSNIVAPRYIDTPSELEKMKSAAFLKFRMLQDIPELRKSWRMNEEEMGLLKECVHKDKWTGCVGKGDNLQMQRRFLNDMETKAVLDDVTSGGAEAVPEFFDDDIIRTPLLFGELSPYIQYVPVSRGSSADGFSIGTPTFVSTASGTAITPFTTTGFVTAFDTTFYPASCAFEWGRDFEEDATPNFMAAVIAQIGDESKRWLDEQIAIGDGTTEPQGIFVASGTQVPPNSSHTFASMVYSDVVKLAFGIGKAARNNFGGNFTRFVMNDAQYRVFMQLATGVTGDTRPIFGMNWNAYRLGDYGVSIQNNISNGNLGLCNLRGYRMYRRAGISFTMEDRGRTLLLSNSKLLLARMRWGGQLTLPSTYMAEMI